MRAYLQLLRLPNVFTAMADILLGFLFTHESLEPWPLFALLLGSSTSLYLAGMALNDYFDRQQDAAERPFRPIPSGQVSPRTAALLGDCLLAGGVALGWLAGLESSNLRPGLVATLLAASVLAYDGLLKRTLLGPPVMGACRMLNVLLGMSLSADAWQSVHYVLAGGIGLYIVGVTVFARREARESERPQLLLGTALMLAGIALVASLPRWASGHEWPPLRALANWELAWGLLAALIVWRPLRAIIDPQPAGVQAAVRNCIFALVIIDAGACLAVQDRFWAIVILAMLLPTMILGRWLYST